ncbi:FkbM family methyltransferase [Paenibacillus dendritiformis]|uniref:Methyltransferase FkbM domain-containing protein n=1 Tax=Paenibacillus dendritiformis C454 TaxID=1131935 RepID=H3S9M6_9BACL|nr:FkbM family methyltransferase [Paenibacillus dendritiformis]EHQ64144.1 hypothetical protein PDENDC454_01025 [Paenibacillus dendritiformis C454]CAH8767333.1 FkbM family methyltransferase [Paenibacillus dendritiformis]
MEFQIRLRDETIISGYKDEYITNVIKTNSDYYEIAELKRFSIYIPNKSIIYDIGANIGNHTIYFCKYYRPQKIYAFEPVLSNADLLEENVALNQLTDIEIIRAAVGSESGKAGVSVNERNMGECKITRDDTGTVEIVSIDELNIEKPDFIKIDVEGNELDVLRGMEEVLASSNPTIWIEINNHFDEVDSFLKKYKYELIDIHHFNYIYIKVDNLDKRLNITQTFKENVVSQYKQTLIDKWNLNKWLSAEKEKLKKSEQELVREKEKFNLEQRNNLNIINGLRLELEEKQKEIENITKKNEVENQKLYNKILYHIEMERRALQEIITLKEHYRIIESRYNRLKKSLPGKIAVRIWKMVKK